MCDRSLNKTSAAEVNNCAVSFNGIKHVKNEILVFEIPAPYHNFLKFRPGLRGVKTSNISNSQQNDIISLRLIRHIESNFTMSSGDVV